MIDTLTRDQVLAMLDSLETVIMETGKAPAITGKEAEAFYQGFLTAIASIRIAITKPGGSAAPLRRE